MAKRSITPAEVKKIVDLGKKHGSRVKVMETTGLDSVTVGTVLAANGLTKSKPSVREECAKRLATWLAAGKPEPKQRKRAKKDRAAA